jgi:DNA-binding transcriptional LysR family regulator
MRFDLIDLRLFVNVAEAGTITGGAERTHMTLASASERVRAMEAELGVALLLRDPRGVQPTEAGRTLLHHARTVLLQMEQMRRELGEYGTGLKGHVRLMCNTSALTEHLHEALSGFLAQHPRISVDLEERTSPDIVEALRHELGDLGIVSDAVDLTGLEAFTFRQDHLVLVVPKGDALAARRRAALGEVLEREFVGLDGASPLQELVSHNARRLGRRLAYRVRVRNLEAVCRMVEQGVGLAVVPQAVALRCAKSMAIARITLTDAWALRDLVVCMRSRASLPANAQLLLQHLLGSA